MKILQINKFFFRKGGSEAYLFDVSAALEKAGHEVIPFSMHDECNQPSPYSDYFIDHIDFSNGKSLSKAAHYLYSTEAARKLERLIQDTQPDIAHVHNIAHQLTPSILKVLRKHNIPVVQTLHDYQLICPNYKLFTQGSPCERCNPHKYWNAIRYKCVQDSRLSSALAAAEMGLHNVLLKSYEKGVTQFIAPSQFLRDKLLEWGWKEDQVTYIPHFSTLTPDTGKRKKQVLFAGRLTKEKGVRVLAEAAAAIDAPVLIAGTGEEEAWLRENAPDNVELLGFQKPEQLHALMAESAAVIVPSLWYENAPMVVYEALALGTPVVGSDIGGIPELIEENANGMLCAVGDAANLSEKVNQLLKTPLQISQNQYNASSHLKQLVTLYEHILA